MKKLPAIITLIILLVAALSCNNEESTWEKYKDWRHTNNDFFTQKDNSVNANGEREYMRVSPVWDAGSYILMKKYKSGNGTKYPLFTSTVDVTYKGYLCNGTVFDSTYTYTDSIVTFKCSSTVTGFAIALTNMVVGDSCEIIIPSYLGYGEQELSAINPYSTLIFGLKLRGIPGYEIQVKP